MARVNNVAIKGYNAEIMKTSDGKRQKHMNLGKKNFWVPA